MRIAYFTAAVTGAGHLVRGAAIERALSRAGFKGEWRLFSPPAPYPVARAIGVETLSMRRDELLRPETALTSELTLALVRFAPDLLVVDMFWAPLRWVLPLAGCETWLIARYCAPIWFAGPKGLEFAPAQYRRIVGIEPFFDHACLTDRIEPIVVCNPDECRPRGALRARLGIAEGERLVAIMHAGLAGEIDTLGADVAAVEARAFDLHADDALFPIAEWLGDADLILSGAGYNAFWEAQWLGYAPRSRFRAFARKMDDQGWRLEHCAGHVMRENGADALARMILAG